VSTVHRVNVNFSESAYRTLQELAERQGKTMSEVIRDAISLVRWFDEVQQSGGRVLVERDGKAREVVWAR
jgi:metal-responsive CopG/Arc/MetJ family transcriptional regulator